MGALIFIVSGGRLDKRYVVLGAGLLFGAGSIGYALSKRKVVVPPIGEGGFAGFEVELINGSAQTTTRQSTGQTATEFRFYPLLDVKSDINGTVSVFWDWRSFWDGSLTAYAWSEPLVIDAGGGKMFSIKNDFPSLIAGQLTRLKLVDTRAGNTRGGSIAIGDQEFIDRQAQDGLWHSLKSEIYQVRVKSPSGAFIDLSGVFGPENFKSGGALTATFAGTEATVI